MKRLTLFTTACVLAVLTLFAAQIRAQQPDTLDRTFISFSSAVELPGITLEAGEYEFRLADTPSRNIVQVFRKSDSKAMGQWTFVEAERERASDATVVMFKEAREGTTPAVQFWYYPNEKVGKEFIYPKDQAERIAARTGQSVRADTGVVNAPSAAAAATTSTASGSASGSIDRAAPSAPFQAESTPRNAPAQAEAQSSAAPVFDAEPRPVGTSGAQAPAPVASAPEPQQQPARANELPRTASPLPISGLVGLLSLAGAAVLRFRRS
jgi:hypothetical protein